MDRLLTSRERLNDPTLRSSVYANEARHSRRKKQQHAAAAAHLMPTHRAPVAAAANVTKNDRRLRGGGSSELEPASLLGSNADFTWYNRRFTMPNRAQQRLEGGGGGAELAAYPAAGCGKPARTQGNCPPTNPNFQWESVNPTYLASNKCNIRHEEQQGNSPICSCAPKDNLEGMLKKKGHAMCTKKPCMGTDCLIKAFKDAQDFVDNIGKVPGLAGLGITESPYFPKIPDAKDFAKGDCKSTPAARQSEIQNSDHAKKSSLVPGSMSPAAAKKPGLAQEATPALPDPSTLPPPKPKKKDEKTEKSKESENTANTSQMVEDTPCGEPKCKSRPRKEKTVDICAECDKNESQKGTNKGSVKGGRSPSGPSGDRPKTAASKSAKSSKGPKFSYNYGNAYPASIYGHKTCGSLRPRVPSHMGWMWNKTDSITKRAPRPGWRPGAISLQLRDLLNEAKAGFFKVTLRPRSVPARSKKDKGPQKTMSFTGKKGMMMREDEEEPEVEYPPTLHIHRKDGVYYVTMYPIRQDGTEARLDEPINPLQFKIVKSKTSMASSSTASDMEIEFSPPAAVNRQKKKPDVVHLETQVTEKEILDETKTSNGSKKKEKPKAPKGK